MAECHCDQTGCEHCGRAEPDGYSPEFDPTRDPTTGRAGMYLQIKHEPNIGGPAQIEPTGSPVRDLADAIRAIAFAYVGFPSPAVDMAVRTGLGLVRHYDGTAGCDVCAPQTLPAPPPDEEP